MHRERDGERAQSFFHDLSKSASSQHLQVFTTPEALQTQSFWGFVEALLHCHE